MNCTTLGMDLATQVFQLHGIDEHGHGVVQKEVFARSVEKETGSDLFLDDECLFRLTPPTGLWPLASLWCQSLR